jgi:hypothetical protein
VTVIVKKLVERRLAGKTEVLGENLTKRHFVRHKSHMTIPGFGTGPPRWEASMYMYINIHHGSGAHFNGVFHKPLPLVCVSVGLSVYLSIVARKQFCKDVPEATKNY